MTATAADLAGRAYARLFAKPGKAQRFNHYLYHLALRGMGYNNGWQPERSGEQWFLNRYMRTNRTPLVIDVGANVGEYARMVLTANPAGTVHCYEPMAGAYRKLQETAGNQVTAFNLAIGDTDGHTVMWSTTDDSELASMMPDNPLDDGGPPATSYNVEVRTLNSMYRECHQAVHLLKIDVEGYEWEALTGATDVLCRTRAVQIEMNLHHLRRGHTLAMFAKHLSDFTPYQLLPHGMRKVDPALPESNTFCYGNFIFLKRPQIDRENRR